MTSTYLIQTLDWRGILIEVRYQNEVHSSCDIVHLELETMEPQRAPLPITETGYRSHFVHRSTIEAQGGPLDFTLAWLEHEARGKGWIEAEAASRQMSFF